MQISWLVFRTGVVLLASVTQLFADFLSCRLMLVDVSAIQGVLMNRPRDCSGPRSLTQVGLHPVWRANVDQGLRGQPTYDGNGVASPVARFRHPCDC